MVARLGRREHLTVGTQGPAGRLRGHGRTPYCCTTCQHAQCLPDKQPVPKLVNVCLHNNTCIGQYC
jgi:hypothetical protein